MRSVRVPWYAATLLIAISSAARAQPAEPGAGAGSAETPEPPPATTGEVSGTVESPDLEAPLAGATVRVLGSNVATTTDDAGHFSLTVNPGSIKLRAESSGFRSEERTITVEAGASVELAFKLTTIPQINETVVIVGSRTPRTNVDSPVAVDVVTAQDIARSGRTETGRILSQLEPSFISTPQTVADGTDHVDPASLRGLGPDQVLVLINGKRQHRSALMHVNGTFGRGTVGTDLNAIPVGSIKRIEILRDGAAAQYGSDAIAGVINIVTKDATDELDLVSEAGITASRDGAQLMTSANYGYKIGQKGFLNLTGEFLQKQATNRAGRYNGPIYSSDGSMDDATLAANGITRDNFKMRIGEAAATTGMGAFDMEVPFDDGTSTFYSFGDVSYRRGSAAGFYRFPMQEAQNVPEFYPNGFLPEIRPTMNDTSVTVGLRRKGPWTVDASLTRGDSAFRFDIENSVNASLGTGSPTTFDAGTLSSSETVANLDLQHKLEQSVLDSSTLVLGSEFRIESYQIHAGDQASYTLGSATYGLPAQPKLPGSQVFPGFQPSNEVDRSRDNIGVYGGLENEVGGGLAVDLGGRFEAYSDFGSSLIGKIAAREKLARWLSLRAAANTGFRAPSLQQLWFSNVSTLFLPDATGALQPEQVLTSNNASPVTKAFGIPKLHEEKSLNLSGGFALRPFDNLSITADGYFIRIDDRIVLTSQFTSSNATVASILAPFPGVSQAQFFANAVDTDTVGADVVADYAIDVPDGQVTLTAAANFSRTKVEDIHIPPSLVAAFGSASDSQLRTFFFGRGAQNRLEDLVPHQKGFTAIRYGTKAFSALLRADYYGRVLYRPDNPADDEVFGAKVLFDADLAYHATKALTFSIGADNLLNTFPDKQVKGDNISFGRFIYSRNVSQFGENGGFYYAKLQLMFL